MLNFQNIEILISLHIHYKVVAIAKIANCDCFLFVKIYMGWSIKQNLTFLCERMIEDFVPESAGKPVFFSDRRGGKRE